MTITRATLGKLIERKTKDVEIGEESVRLQRPTPRQFAEYQMSMVDPKTREFDITRFTDALVLLVARMWIDDQGERLFGDDEVSSIADTVELSAYQSISEACQKFASDRGEENKMLGESEQTTS